MTDWRTYPGATRAAIAVLSQGSCYFPGCGIPIVVSVGGQPEVNVEMVRIRNAEPDRPRHVAGITDDTAGSFGNLLLLCVPHRRTIDRDENAHPIDLLETWKARREGSGYHALQDVGTLPEDRIDELLTTAFSAVQEQVRDAISRFEKADPEAAQLLRQLVDGLNAQRSHHGGELSRLDEVAGRLDELMRKLEKTPKRVNIGWST